MKPLLLLSLCALPVLCQAQEALPELPSLNPATADTAPANPATANPATANPATAPDEATKLRESTAAYNAGIGAIKRNDWNSAAQNFAKAAELSPSDAGAWSFLGYVRLQQKDWKNALSALERAEKSAKDLDVKARAQLNNNIGFAKWNAGDFPGARVAFESALKLQPSYFDARYNLAFALLSKDLHADAIPHLRQISTLAPKDSAIFDGLGEAYDKTGNQPASLAAYKKAIELDPKNENTRFKFALVLLQGDRRAEAAAQLREVLAINPQNASALLQLGDLHLRSNKWADAASALKRYIALKGNDFTGRFNLGVAYDYSAKFDDALMQYAEAEKLNPKDAATKNNVGRIYFKRGRFDEAVEKFNAALAINPNFHDARTNLAIVLAAQNKLPESNAAWNLLAEAAEKGVRSATKTYDRNLMRSRLATAYSGLASNFLAQTPPDADKAAEQYQKLLASNPNDADARSGLGRALFLKKDYPGAIAAYRAVTVAQPKNANAFNDLGVVLEASKDRKGALEAYTQALQLQPNHAEAKANLARLSGKATLS